MSSVIAEAEIVTVQISFSDTGEADEATLQGECAANGDLTCHEEALEEMKSNMQAIMEKILSLRDSSETIIRVLNIYDPFPDNAALEDVGFPRDYTETIRPVTEEWNRYICGLAEENGLPCADIYHAFNRPKGTKSPSGMVSSPTTASPANYLLGRIDPAAGAVTIFPESPALGEVLVASISCGSLPTQRTRSGASAPDVRDYAWATRDQRRWTWSACQVRPGPEPEKPPRTAPARE